MALAAAVQEELEFMRQLKVYHEVLADLVLKVGEPKEFEAYRLLLRRGVEPVVRCRPSPPPFSLGARCFRGFVHVSLQARVPH